MGGFSIAMLVYQRVFARFLSLSQGKTSFKKTEKTEKAGKWENMGAQATFMMAIPRCQRLQEVFFS